jgi:hypothetical protein
MIDYYKTLISQTKNPNHLAYYKKMLKIFNGEKTQNNYTPRYMFKINVNRVHSPILNKNFRTMADASRYVGKGRSYARRCIIGELENKYEFKII